MILGPPELQHPSRCLSVPGPRYSILTNLHVLATHSLSESQIELLYDAGSPGAFIHPPPDACSPSESQMEFLYDARTSIPSRTPYSYPEPQVEFLYDSGSLGTSIHSKTPYSYPEP